jgi:shikimate kinase
MGSGKSSVGRLVARTLGGRFVDTDKLVVDRMGCEITDIFATSGEAGFRIAETEALCSLEGEQGLVIATGGGIVTVPGNIPVLRRLGHIVWLDAAEETIWDRVSRNKNRPLLHTPNPRETIRSLLELRNPLYESIAELRIDTTFLSHAEVVEKICALVRR